jgi:glycosyltransferase involved in cell wall biosynthesis
MSGSDRSVDSLSLTIAVSTVGDRMTAITLPPPSQGVSILVLVQQPGENCEARFCDRNDVRVIRLTSLGVSRSRNAALDRATTDLLLFLDDDISLNMSGVDAMRAMFAAQPDLALAAGWRHEHVPNTPRLRRLTRFNSGRVCPPGIMVRTNAFATAKIRFDADFGVGTTLPAGEEYIFVTDALKAGLRGLSVPVIMGSHPGPSTGDHWGRSDLLLARQQVLRRVFGNAAIFIRPVYAWKNRNRFKTRSQAVRFALGLSKNRG